VLLWYRIGGFTRENFCPGFGQMRGQQRTLFPTVDPQLKIIHMPK
jgi:hypothetical protein